MIVGSQLVRFHLSPEGQRALRGLVPAGSLQATIVGQDSLGVTIWRPLKRSKLAPERIPVMLLKWEYIATMAFDYRPQLPVSRMPIGFGAVATEPR